MARLSCRDALIVKLRRDGSSVRELAARFCISRSRVHMIVSRHDQEARKREEVGKLQAVLREADDIGKKWSASFLLEALSFPHLPHRALKHYFEDNAVQSFNLKELMNFLIPQDAEAGYEPWRKGPAFRTKGIGRKTYKSFVRHLSQQDLGTKFNQEWEQRTEKIKDYIKE